MTLLAILVSIISEVFAIFLIWLGWTLRQIKKLEIFPHERETEFQITEWVIEGIV